MKKNKLPLPAANYEMEIRYKEALKDYIRPAKTMFAGSFSEVRDFNERLNRTMDSSLYILSTRYGLITESEKIIPYKTEPFTSDILDRMNRKQSFLKEMTKLSANADYVLLLMPRNYIEYLIDNKWLQDLPSYVKIIAVTSPLLEKYFNTKTTIVLPRVGVARIGKKNKEEILELLEEE
ncbi:hypothetical protein KA005_15670 [bacterium]|nr:hypothetical protein [bacterium]